MAYLDTCNVFSYAATSPAAMPADLLPPPAEPQDFDHTEWTVIALARNDALATLREPRQRSTLGRMFLGRPRNYALAAERLEALRHVAVEAWRQPQAISLPALGRFIAVGFSAAQLRLLLSITGALPALGTAAAAENIA